MVGAEVELADDALGIGSAVSSTVQALDSEIVRGDIGKVIAEITGYDVGKWSLRLSPLGIGVMMYLAKMGKASPQELLNGLVSLAAAFPGLAMFSQAGASVASGSGGAADIVAAASPGYASGRAAAKAAKGDSDADTAAQAASPAYATYRAMGGEALF